MGLHFFDVLIVREVALEMFGAAESVQIDEYGVILDLTGVFHAEVVRVGEHGHDLLFDLVRVFAQIDAHPDILGSMKDILEKGCFFCCIDIDKTEHAFYCIDTRNRALLYISNLVCGIM